MRSARMDSKLSSAPYALTIWSKQTRCWCSGESVLIHVARQFPISVARGYPAWCDAPAPRTKTLITVFIIGRGDSFNRPASSRMARVVSEDGFYLGQTAVA